jgi:hypothetical protein
MPFKTAVVQLLTPLRKQAPVAQLDRAPESGGQGFESLPAHSRATPLINIECRLLCASKYPGLIEVVQIHKRV